MGGFPGRKMGRRSRALRALALRNLERGNQRMNPRVSICLPCFNAARWVAHSVESALDQTWPNKEIIVVDDGSSDGSMEMLEAFGTKIRLLRREHRGGNPARNEALRVATGEWVQFVDADDFLLPDKIARQFDEADGGADADVIYSPVWIETTTNGRQERVASDTSPQLDI